MTRSFSSFLSIQERKLLEDGELVDVSQMAQEAGFRIPVALTRAVYERYVVVPRGVPCQDQNGRLWDVLWMLRLAIRSASNQREIRFRVYVRNDNCSPNLVELKALCGPGDDSKPVITICMPSED